MTESIGAVSASTSMQRLISKNTPSRKLRAMSARVCRRLSPKMRALQAGVPQRSLFAAGKIGREEEAMRSRDRLRGVPVDVAVRPGEQIAQPAIARAGRQADPFHGRTTHRSHAG